MNQTDFRVLNDDELDAINGAKGKCATVVEATVFDIAGKGELEIGTKTLCSGQVVAYAHWTPK